MSRSRPTGDDLLATPLDQATGTKTATALASLGLVTVADLLRHLPRRYAHRGELTDIGSLVEGEFVTVVARVASVKSRDTAAGRWASGKGRQRTLTEVVITDGRADLTLVFFNQRWRERELRVAESMLFSGQVSRFKSKLQLTHPEYEPFDDDDDAEAMAQRPIPIYRASAKVTSWQVRRCVDQVLAQLGQIEDPLPAEVREARGLLALDDAFRAAHQPSTDSDWRAAQERFRFEEAFTLQVVLAQRRAELGALPATMRAPARTPLRDAFDARLPFTLTSGQVEVGEEISADLARDHPMHRLLQGEVGSGKTLIALRAMLTVVDAGGQAALLAPTEVLAMQHHRVITALLGPLADAGRLGAAETATRVALLTGSKRAAERRTAMLDIVSGDAGIVIGTHALIQDSVDFHDLALVVVDEQHRFGVEQRAALAAKARDGSRPHVLVMTATPIPRTVAMTVFGDLDVSTLAELPAGRADVATHVVPVGERPDLVARAWERIREEAARGHRTFVVCPRIGEDGADALPDEEVDAPYLPDASEVTAQLGTAVLSLVETLGSGPLSGLRLAALHGRMSADEKDDVMRRFTADPGDPDAVDVVVATTVIEVGIDVPQATVMVIMDAERFGISQLHQLRGRIARGDLPGLCLLFTQAPRDSLPRGRLDAVAATTDGFALAALDLDIRREGDVLGAAQSGGRSSLQMLSVTRDVDVIVAARAAATDLIAADPMLVDHLALAWVVADLRNEEQSAYLERG